MRTGANLKCKSPALLTTRGLHQNSLYDLKDSPSCLAVCFTWPQVALTHHALSTAIETSLRRRVNAGGRRVTGSCFPIYDLRFTIYHLPSCVALFILARSIPLLTAIWTSA